MPMSFDELSELRFPILEYAAIADRESQMDHWKDMLRTSSADARYVSAQETRMFAAFASLTVRERIAALLPKRADDDVSCNHIRTILPETKDQFEFHYAQASARVRNAQARAYRHVYKSLAEDGLVLDPNVDLDNLSATMLADAKVLARETLDLHAIRGLTSQDVFDDLYLFTQARQFYDVEVPLLPRYSVESLHV